MLQFAIESCIYTSSNISDWSLPMNRCHTIYWFSFYLKRHSCSIEVQAPVSENTAGHGNSNVYQLDLSKVAKTNFESITWCMYEHTLLLLAVPTLLVPASVTNMQQNIQAASCYHNINSFRSTSYMIFKLLLTDRYFRIRTQWLLQRDVPWSYTWGFRYHIEIPNTIFFMSTSATKGLPTSWCLVLINQGFLLGLELKAGSAYKSPSVKLPSVRHMMTL